MCDRSDTIINGYVAANTPALAPAPASVAAAADRDERL